MRCLQPRPKEAALRSLQCALLVLVYRKFLKIMTLHQQSVSVPAAKRRRVPIRVVETPAQSKIQPPVGGPSQSLSSDGLAPISTRRLTPSNANGSISARPSNSASVAVSTVTPSGSASQSQVRLQAGRSSSSHRAEANGDNPTTARVGGGIFRSSGAHTVVQPPQALNTNGSSASHAPNGNGALNGRTPPRKPPATSSAFTKSWETSSPSERWELLLVRPRLHILCSSTPLSEAHTLSSSRPVTPTHLNPPLLPSVSRNRPASFVPTSLLGCPRVRLRRPRVKFGFRRRPGAPRAHPEIPELLRARPSLSYATALYVCAGEGAGEGAC